MTAGNKTLALVVKKLCVTSSPQCYFKAISAKAAEMLMPRLLPQVYLRFVRAAKHLEEINILKSGSLIKLVKVTFSDTKRLLDFCAGHNKHSVSRTTIDTYICLIRHTEKTSQKENTVRNQCIQKVCNHQAVWTLSDLI